MLVVWQRYHNTCLITFQCLQVGVKLYLISKLIENVICGCVQLARCINVSIALRYGTSG